MKWIFCLSLLALILFACTSSESGSGTGKSNSPSVLPQRVVLGQDFFDWGRGGGSSIDLEAGGTDQTGTGYSWRTKTNGNCNLTTVGEVDFKGTPAAGTYLYTVFANDGSNISTTSIDMTHSQAALQLYRPRVWDAGLQFKFMVYDGDWHICGDTVDLDSRPGPQNFTFVSSASGWAEVVQSSSLTAELTTSNPLPTITSGPSSSPNWSAIRGVGVFLESNLNSVNRFTLTSILAHEVMPEIEIDTGLVLSNDVNPHLFGACATGYSYDSVDADILQYLSEWCEVMRWPGGANIEYYNMKYAFNNQPSNTKNSSLYVGNWMDRVRQDQPNMDFIVGVPSSLGMSTPTDANTNLSNWLTHSDYAANGLPDIDVYASEIVSYLNNPNNTPWGVQPARSSSANLRYIEVGNEPDWMFNNHSNYTGLSVADKFNLYNPSYAKCANALHTLDPSVDVIGPTFMKGAVDGGVKLFMQANGDIVDLVTTHRYDPSPHAYRHDIRILKDHIKKYGVSNSRRSKDEIKIGYTEFNEHNHSEDSWAKAMWLAEVFTYFIEGGVDLATMWHIRMGNSHALYAKNAQNDYAPLPPHFVFKFFHDHSELANSPKVISVLSGSKDLRMVALETTNYVTLFVVNLSASQVTEQVKFRNVDVDSSADIWTLTEDNSGQWPVGSESHSTVNLTSQSLQHSFSGNTVTCIRFAK